MMKLAAQLYTVRNYTFDEKEVNLTFERIKLMGYEGVQLSGLKFNEPKAIKKALTNNDLIACATHSSFDRIVGDTDALIDEHILFGTKYLGLGFYRFNTMDDIKIFLDKLNPAIDKISKAGLQFVYHNHAHEFKKIDGIIPLYYLRDNTDNKFGFLPDFYWVHSAGLSCEKFIDDFSGRINVTHFKDMRVKPDDSKTSMAEIFEGNMDYEGIYKACIRENVEWAVVEQDDCDDNPFDSLKKSFDNIKSRKMFDL